MLIKLLFFGIFNEDVQTKLSLEENIHFTHIMVINKIIHMYFYLHYISNKLCGLFKNYTKWFYELSHNGLNEIFFN